MRREGGGLPRAVRAAAMDFPKADPEGNPEEVPCQPKENSVLPEYLSILYPFLSNIYSSRAYKTKY